LGAVKLCNNAAVIGAPGIRERHSPITLPRAKHEDESALTNA